MDDMLHIARITPWNLVVHARPGMGPSIRELLHDLGRLSPSARADFFPLYAEDPIAALRQLQLWRRFNPAIGEAVERVVLLTEVFDYSSPDEFESRATASLSSWRSRLTGKCVCVRREESEGTTGADGVDQLGDILHRLVGALADVGGVTCRDPDVILSFAGNDHWAGLSVWPRSLREHYPELCLDGPQPAAA